jgi:hypothetical protein
VLLLGSSEYTLSVMPLAASLVVLALICKAANACCRGRRAQTLQPYKPSNRALGD